MPGSVADDCKLIHPGECVLESNGHDLQQASIDNAIIYFHVGESETEREGGGGRGIRGN